jgi:glutamate synthase (NADPH/NADH) small chain
MGKTTGFLEYARKDYKKRPAKERLEDWNEIRLPQDWIPSGRRLPVV